MKSVYSFIVYAKEQPKQFSGILGDIDLYPIHILLLGGTQLPQEEFNGNVTKAAQWYTSYLHDNDVTVRHVKTTGKLLWFEVDLLKTEMNQFTYYHELEKGDTETIVWRTFWYPCTKGTVRECLGLAIVNMELSFSGVPLESIFQTILTTRP
jgi:hypothetical protein